jgi:hypothetical protein
MLGGCVFAIMYLIMKTQSVVVRLITGAFLKMDV